MTTADLLLQFVLSGVMVGSIYALIALGFNVVYHATEAINFAQGAQDLLEDEAVIKAYLG
jgi:branched-chain amino acid transport system permease protein